MFRKRTPIPWLQLRYQKAQTFAAILGIAFTTILLFMQIGFRSGFLDTFIDLPNRLRGDLIVINAATVTVLRPASFSQRRLAQTLAFEEVDSVTPIYATLVVMRDPTGQQRFLRKIQLFAFPLANNPFDIGAVDDNLEKLKRSNVFLIDSRSRPEFASVIEKVRNDGRMDIEIRIDLRQVRISVEGLFALGINASNDAHLLSSDETFVDLVRRDPNLINIGVIKLKPGVDPADMARRLGEYLPSDVVVLDRKSLIAEELHFYEFETPIGIIFRFGLGGAIVIGIVILYQILYQIISKYLRDFATLKAIGYSHGALRLVVLKEALLLAVIGFVPGFLSSFYMYKVLSNSTSLEFSMSAGMAIVVLVTVCLICLVSAAFAIRKLREADPAEFFE